MKNAPTFSIEQEQTIPSKLLFRKRELIVQIISALFILLFVYTSLNKFLLIHLLKITLKEYPIIGGMSDFIAWGLPVFEVITALLLFIPKIRLWGLYISFALMTAFTFYVSYMFVFTPKLPCTCGGMLHQLSWPQHLVFNIAFVLLAFAGIVLEKRNAKLKNDENNIDQIVFT